MAARKPYVNRSKERDQLFIDALLDGNGPTQAAPKAGYSVAAVYKYRNDDEDFAKRWEEAHKIGTQVQIAMLEAEADRRAMDGVVGGYAQVGKKNVKIMKYSDSLLMFRLKKLDPTYRDKMDIKHSGAVNNVMVVPGCSSVDDWEKASQAQHEETLGE